MKTAKPHEHYCDGPAVFMPVTPIADYQGPPWYEPHEKKDEYIVAPLDTDDFGNPHSKSMWGIQVPGESKLDARQLPYRDWLMTAGWLSPAVTFTFKDREHAEDLCRALNAGRQLRKVEKAIEAALPPDRSPRHSDGEFTWTRAGNGPDRTAKRTALPDAVFNRLRDGVGFSVECPGRLSVIRYDSEHAAWHDLHRALAEVTA